MWSEIKSVWKLFGDKVSVAAREAWSPLWSLFLGLVIAVKDALANFLKASWKIITGLVSSVWSLLADALWGTLKILWNHLWSLLTRVGK